MSCFHHFVHLNKGCIRECWIVGFLFMWQGPVILYVQPSSACTLHDCFILLSQMRSWRWWWFSAEANKDKSVNFSCKSRRNLVESWEMQRVEVCKVIIWIWQGSTMYGWWCTLTSTVTYPCHMLLLLVCMPFPGLKIDRSFGSFLLSCANDGCSLLETSVMLPALVGHRELVPPRFRVLSSEWTGLGASTTPRKCLITV